MHFCLQDASLNSDGGGASEDSDEGGADKLPPGDGLEPMMDPPFEPELQPDPPSQPDPRSQPEVGSV